jgi:mycothiol synthase
MTVDLAPCLSADDMELLRTLVGDPSLASEFDRLMGPGRVEEALSDPFCDPSLRRIACVNGTPVGFSFVYVLPSWNGTWAMITLGVLGPRRRSGLGSVLLRAALDGLRTHAPHCAEACVAAWMPNDGAASFAAHHGFHHARFSWQMERNSSPSTPPQWPTGIEVRHFDGSEAALADWNTAYNLSFADQYHGVISSIEDCRWLAGLPEFRPHGLLLAYRDGRCVGFCRNELSADCGEVAMLGVIPDARKTGLGRALLRSSIGRLLEMQATRIRLMVDGENERAIDLYRSEGFETQRMRELWSRPMSA